MFVAAIAKGIAKPFQFQLGPRSFHNWNGWKRTDPFWEHWENLKGARVLNASEGVFYYCDVGAGGSILHFPRRGGW